MHGCALARIIPPDVVRVPRCQSPSRALRPDKGPALRLAQPGTDHGQRSRSATTSSFSLSLSLSFIVDVLALQALEMAARHWSHPPQRSWLDLHVPHAHQPSRRARSDDIGAGNAIVQAVKTICKAKPIRQCGPRKTVEEVKMAILPFVWWWSSTRSHGEIDLCIPLTVESACSSERESLLAPVTGRTVGPKRLPNQQLPGGRPNPPQIFQNQHN